jgi:phosphoglycerol transferase MdoB-like AlkP superfamily enzyme
MELESLKYIWRSMEAPSDVEHDRQALVALLQKKSQAPITRMRRNLIGEGILLLVAYTPAILLFLLGFDGRLAAISWLFILLLGFFFGYYYRKYRLLSKMQCPTCQLRSNLARQVDTLKRYTRFYLLAGTGMIPLAYGVAWLILRWKYPSATTPVLWLLLLIPITIGVYYINASYVNRLYGQHIKKLQDLLSELDSE